MHAKFLKFFYETDDSFLKIDFQLIFQTDNPNESFRSFWRSFFTWKREWMLLQWLFVNFKSKGGAQWKVTKRLIQKLHYNNLLKNNKTFRTKFFRKIVISGLLCRIKFID